MIFKRGKNLRIKINGEANMLQTSLSYALAATLPGGVAVALCWSNLSSEISAAGFAGGTEEQVQPESSRGAIASATVPALQRVSDRRIEAVTAPNTKDISAPMGMVWIPGGEFTMGTDDIRSFPNERPAHRVQVEGFWIDEHDVTNAEFAKFVEATGYVTTAERKPD
jgi:formylglycine-generating enzyme required for sulfatase activity